MDISRGQWLVALAVAVCLHLLILAAMRWSGPPAPPATDSPKGVMISLYDFDQGPPLTSIDDLPIENLRENADVGPPPAAPAQTAQPDTPSVAAGESNTTSPPPSAAPIGPAPAPDAEEPTIADAPSTAGAEDPEAAQAPSPDNSEAGAAITAAVSVRPGDTLADIKPGQQVIARDATDMSSLAEAAATAHNGAYGSSEEATNDYVVKLRAWLSQHKRYPKPARAANREGTVRLYLAVDASGHVLEHRIAQSSGVPSLDQAANDMLARAEPLPPMPSASHRNRLELVIPIVFTLH